MIVHAGNDLNDYIECYVQGKRKVVNSGGGLISQKEKNFYGEKLNPMENS